MNPKARILFSLLIRFCSLMVTVLALSSPKEQHYRYFAYGSNMSPSTLTALRSVHPLNSTAAILIGYKLRFNVAGIPGLEPSAASVEKNVGSVVHGVCFTLSENDFARVGKTEGVPFLYRWQRCHVFPYVGDGDKAGCDAVSSDPFASSVSAWTLVATNPSKKDIPTSQGYLDIIVDAAKEWNMDESHLNKLETTPVARTAFGKGLASASLKVAKLWRSATMK